MKHRIKALDLTRRRFLKTALKAGALAFGPQIVSSSVLGMNGSVPPSERIVLGGIGIGRRGSYVLSCFLAEPDVQFAAVCDIQASRRAAVKKMADDQYGNDHCATYRDLRDLLARKDIDAVLIATGSNWHALASVMAAEAGKDIYCEKPCSKNIAQSIILRDAIRRTGRVFQAGTQRRSLPHFMFAVDLARRGKLGNLRTLSAHPSGPLIATMSTMSGWRPVQPTPPRNQIDWDIYLGPAAWRPYNGDWLYAFDFEKGGGFTGGGCVEWGIHTVDLCQWANNADKTAPVEFAPSDGQIHARYANGVQLIIRDSGWNGQGTRPVRFEGDEGWVETGDDGGLIASSPSLLKGKGAKVTGYPADFHVRNFLDCIKTRGQTRANANVMCETHIACHAANISWFLNRPLRYDPVRNMFSSDDQANRLRSEALREPWML